MVPLRQYYVKQFRRRSIGRGLQFAVKMRRDTLALTNGSSSVKEQHMYMGMLNLQMSLNDKDLVIPSTVTIPLYGLEKQ